MPTYVLIVDLVGAVLAVIGFHMAFRQAMMRRMVGRLLSRPPQSARPDGTDDPITYALRIAGVMIMVFGLGMAGMTTMYQIGLAAIR